MSKAGDRTEYSLGVTIRTMMQLSPKQAIVATTSGNRGESPNVQNPHMPDVWILIVILQLRAFRRDDAGPHHSGGLCPSDSSCEFGGLDSKSEPALEVRLPHAGRCAQAPSPRAPRPEVLGATVKKQGLGATRA